MSISTPPSIFFSGINFNPAFYSIGDEAVSFKFIDANYLRSTNYATSRAAYTQFYGIIYAIGGISGDGSQLTSLNASNVSSGTLPITRGGIGTTILSSNQLLIGNGTTSILQSANLIWNNTTNTLSSTNFVGSGSGITNLDYNNININKPNLNIYALQTYVDGSLNTINNTLTTKESILSFTSPLIRTGNNITINGSSLNGLNASNVTLGTLPVTRGGIGTTTLNNNQVLLGNGTNAINQTNNLLFDTSNNRLGICKSSPNYTLDVSGNINGNNLYLQNLSNPNNTLINILSEINDFNSKLVVGSGYIGANRAISSFVDVSTCQIITKTNNLYIDSALNKSVYINA